MDIRKKYSYIFLFNILLVSAFLFLFSDFLKAYTFSDSRIPVKGNLWKTWFDKGLRNLEKGAYKSAVSHLNTALMLKPDSAEILNNLGVAFYRQKNFEKAEGFFLRSKFKNPKLIDPNVNLGLVYYEQKKWNQLKMHAIEFLDLFPDSGIAYFGLGISSYYLSEFVKAEKFLEKSLEDNQASYEYAGEARKIILKCRSKKNKTRSMPWEN
jgi:tetratricopeptide (TPR) repeat protein